jgi:hypothetical protein
MEMTMKKPEPMQKPLLLNFRADGNKAEKYHDLAWMRRKSLSALIREYLDAEVAKEKL